VGRSNSLPHLRFVQAGEGDIGILFDGQLHGLAERQGMGFGLQETGECQCSERRFEHAFMVAYAA
jgi:hypothetical protein